MLLIYIAKEKEIGEFKLEIEEMFKIASYTIIESLFIFSTVFNLLMNNNTFY